MPLCQLVLLELSSHCFQLQSLGWLHLAAEDGSQILLKSINFSWIKESPDIFL